MNRHKPTMEELLRDQDTVRRVTGSADAQALAQLLCQHQDAGALREAAKKAASGDTAELCQVLRELAENPQGAVLLQRLQSQFGTF